MPLNLPPTLGSRSFGSTPQISKIGVPKNIGRAQSTTVGKINQRVDRDNARVSMNQLLSAKAEARGEKTTSINRVGNVGNIAHTSTARYQTNIKTSINDTVGYDQNTHQSKSDDKRYDYVRHLIAKRKAKEAQLLLKKLKDT